MLGLKLLAGEQKATVGAFLFAFGMSACVCFWYERLRLLFEGIC